MRHIAKRCWIRTRGRGAAARGGGGHPDRLRRGLPGNFRHLIDAPTQLLVVEGEFSAQLYRERLREHAPPLAVIPPARYDPLRAPARALVPQAPPWRVLWAGQPETESCLATLRGVLPFLRSPEIELLFRAHPRDPGPAAGAYREIEAMLAPRWRDVGAVPLAQLLAEPLRLVLTQYSSVAVEAGFAGVPSVHVLFAHAGGALLHSQKGYRVPMPCAAGASFLLEDRAQAVVLDQALRDDDVRRVFMARFRKIYHADAPQAANLARTIAGIIA